MERYIPIMERMYKFKLLEDYYLYEYTYQIGKDVDLLFNRFIKKELQNILKGNFNQKLLNSSRYPKFVYKFNSTDSSILQTKDCKKAHELNPINISFKVDYSIEKNYYDFHAKNISITLNTSCIDNLIRFNANFDKIKSKLGNQQFKKFLAEISEDRIKGGIYHELSHWISDSIHNQHIANRRKDEVPEEKYYEIDGLVHAIKQLKRNHKKEWDILTLSNLVEYLPSISMTGLEIYKKKGEKSFIAWQKNLIKRLDREKLLGNNMKKFLTIRDIL